MSAGGVDPINGIKGTHHHDDHLIVAHMRFVYPRGVPVAEQGAVGQIHSDMVQMTTYFSLADGRVGESTRDNVIWTGVSYRVNGASVPSRVDRQWATMLNHGPAG